MATPQLPSEEDRFCGCLLGLAIGDALGAFFEGQPPESLASRYRSAAELLSNPPPGDFFYTDDTQMTIGVAETLISCGQINHAVLCERFAKNFLPQRGYGRGARQVLHAMLAGEDHQSLAETLFPGGSFGNGAAMRVAPVGLMFRDDHQLVWDQALLSALPTHVHPLGIEGAQLLALAIAVVSTAEQFNRQAFWRVLLDRSQAVEYRAALRRAEKLDSARDLVLFGNGVDAASSVVTAIAAFSLTPDSYADTIANSILLGGDTDTIAAMAGAISGAYLGLSAVPQEFLDRLEDQHQGRTYIHQLAQQLWKSHQLRIGSQS